MVITSSMLKVPVTVGEKIRRSSERRRETAKPNRPRNQDQGGQGVRPSLHQRQGAEGDGHRGGTRRQVTPAAD